MAFSSRGALALNPDKPIRQYLLDYWHERAGLPQKFVLSCSKPETAISGSARREASRALTALASPSTTIVLPASSRRARSGRSRRMKRERSGSAPMAEASVASNRAASPPTRRRTACPVTSSAPCARRGRRPLDWDREGIEPPPEGRSFRGLHFGTRPAQSSGTGPPSRRRGVLWVGTDAGLCSYSRDASLRQHERSPVSSPGGSWPSQGTPRAASTLRPPATFCRSSTGAPRAGVQQDARCPG